MRIEHQIVDTPSKDETCLRIDSLLLVKQSTYGTNPFQNTNNLDFSSKSIERNGHATILIELLSKLCDHSPELHKVIMTTFYDCHG